MATLHSYTIEATATIVGHGSADAVDRLNALLQRLDRKRKNGDGWAVHVRASGEDVRCDTCGLEDDGCRLDR